MKIALALASVAPLVFSPVAGAENSPFNRAVSLVSVAFFEVDYCPGVVVNGPLFRVGLVDSGADLTHDDEAIQTMAKANAVSMHEKDDVGRCADFWARLGPNGTDVLGLLSRGH